MKERTQVDISSKDTMYEGNRDHYFSVGQSALHCVKSAMLAANKSTVRNILDFGCGFGRVLRVLKTAFPSAELTACDISRDAIEFCASTFGATPVLSSVNPAEIRFQNKFDLIWCGSLLTHFDAPQFSNFLELLQSLLSSEGLMVFTTHGPYVARRLRSRVANYGLEEQVVTNLVASYDSAGFGYVDYPSEVPPLIGVTKYGFCVSKPSWVCSQVESLSGLHLMVYTERAWDHHQDSIGCTKQ